MRASPLMLRSMTGSELVGPVSVLAPANQGRSFAYDRLGTIGEREAA